MAISFLCFHNLEIHNPEILIVKSRSFLKVDAVSAERSTV